MSQVQTRPDASTARVGLQEQPQIDDGRRDQLRDLESCGDKSRGEDSLTDSPQVG